MAPAKPSMLLMTSQKPASSTAMMLLLWESTIVETGLSGLMTIVSFCCEGGLCRPL